MNSTRKNPKIFIVNKDFDAKNEYDNGFSVNELFPLNNVGIVTARDGILINENKNELLKNVSNYYKIEANTDFVKNISYRPFDNRKVYFDTKLIERSREKVMQHFLKGENVGLITAKQSIEKDLTIIQVSNYIIDNRCQFSYKGIPSIFPSTYTPMIKTKIYFRPPQYGQVATCPNLSRPVPTRQPIPTRQPVPTRRPIPTRQPVPTRRSIPTNS